MSTTALAAALDALAAAAAAAGIERPAARAEGARLAAAVAESLPGAPTDWLPATGRPTSATLQPFFDAAVSARRWRSAPTDLLEELVTNGSPHAGTYAEALATVVDAAAELRRPKHQRHSRRRRAPRQSTAAQPPGRRQGTDPRCQPPAPDLGRARPPAQGDPTAAPATEARRHRTKHAKTAGGAPRRARRAHRPGPRQDKRSTGRPSSSASNASQPRPASPPPR